MNRPVPGASSLRGMPGGGFSNAQQLPQNRSASSRLPNGKMATNGATWTGFGGVPMGSVGMQNQRPTNGPMTSFAQTIGGSQPATPLDLSEFPSLSTNPQQQQQQSSISTPSLWTGTGARGSGQPGGQRPQPQGLMSAHQQTQAQQQTQQQQDDLFSSSSQLPNTQSGFRFGGQSAVGQPQPTSASDDFPPLSRNINGEIGQDRSGLLQGFGQGNSGFGNTTGGSSSAQGNGLLNALSNSNRAASTAAQGTSATNLGLPLSRSPAESSRQNMPDSESEFGRSPVQNMDVQSRNGQMSSSQGAAQGLPQTTDFRLPSRQDQVDNSTPEVEDPLAGFSDKDRFGLKGLTAVLNNYPEQATLIAGIDVSNFGADIGSTERITNMIWSPYEDAAPRPPIPNYTLPDCYAVHNVQQIENKMTSFSDETLMYMFYSNPQDVQQIMAAHELATRNWRYHKKLQTWLTKDEMMVPQPLGDGIERGYYIFFDKVQWTKERRELVLNYSDLEQTVGNGRLP